MRLRRFAGGFLCAVLVSCWAVSTAITPLAIAGPPQIPAPRGPLLGQSCDDLDKLAYDPSVGQIVCTGAGTWVRSVTPTGVRSTGAPCTAAEMDSVMASSTDGHLIFCPSYRGVWTLYRP